MRLSTPTGALQPGHQSNVRLYWNIECSDARLQQQDAYEPARRSAASGTGAGIERAGAGRERTGAGIDTQGACLDRDPGRRRGVFRVRGIARPDAARERILAQKDPERLERWLEKAIVAASVDEVIDDPS